MGNLPTRTHVHIICYGSAALGRAPFERLGHLQYFRSIAQIIQELQHLYGKKERDKVVVRLYGGQIGADEKAEADSCADWLASNGVCIRSQCRVYTQVFETISITELVAKACICKPGTDEHILICDEVRGEFTETALNLWLQAIGMEHDEKRLTVWPVYRPDDSPASTFDHQLKSEKKLKELGVLAYRKEHLLELHEAGRIPA